jgi:hypothetical protein
MPDFRFGHQQRLAAAFRNFDGFNLWGVHPIVRGVQKRHFWINFYENNRL